MFCRFDAEIPIVLYIIEVQNILQVFCLSILKADSKPVYYRCRYCRLGYNRGKSNVLKINNSIASFIYSFKIEYLPV